jgi:hypothetical protein
MGHDGEHEDLRELPGPGPKTPSHPVAEKKHRRPKDRKRTLPFPYADRFGEWVADETSRARRPGRPQPDGRLEG